MSSPRRYACGKIDRPTFGYLHAPLLFNHLVNSHVRTDSDRKSYMDTDRNGLGIDLRSNQIY
eukprot:CAMPEP_0194282280 /NCGR_PEP_ID=MMETSP0169-20130528/22813_1 /TAXON_ID=218684 /ORGANISM="Corethron pennatum, Strain L29A3" /LENGTH=61 /DNA_ID=CAMNT_0039027551 /DNA_START=667 /DNA_END=852 /DNA_ORIENTATION=+